MALRRCRTGCRSARASDIAETTARRASSPDYVANDNPATDVTATGAVPVTRRTDQSSRTRRTIEGATIDPQSGFTRRDRPIGLHAGGAVMYRSVASRVSLAYIHSVIVSDAANRIIGYG